MIAYRTIVITMIGTVLLCPYSCLVELEGGSACAQQVSCDDQDSCCPSPKDTPAPCPAQDGSNCLCHGAVMEHVTHVPTLELQPMSVGSFSDVFAAESVSVRTDEGFQPSACDFAIAQSGRRIRALIESLLI